MSTRPAALLLGLILCSANAWAGTVAVPLAGTFDQASVAAERGLPAGDDGIPVDYVMTFTVEAIAVPVPVPATISLFSAAFAGLLLVSWWKQR